MSSLRTMQELRNLGEISREKYWTAIREFLLDLEEFNSWQVQQGVQIKLDRDGLLIETNLIRDGHEREVFRVNPLQIRSAPFTILADGVYEQFQLEVAANLARNSEVFIDVGTNIGVYCVALAKRFPRLEIHAFEPLLECFILARENFILNHCSSYISINNFALGDVVTTKEFFIPKFTGNAGASFAHQHPDEGEPIKEIVEIKTLDSLSFTKVDLVKIDVEGFEFQVLQGAREILAREKPTVIVEILRKWSKSFDNTPQDSFNLLMNMGYECYEIREHHVSKIVELNNLTPVTNFIFCHNDRKLHLRTLKSFSE